MTYISNERVRVEVENASFLSDAEAYAKMGLILPNEKSVLATAHDMYMTRDHNDEELKQGMEPCFFNRIKISEISKFLGAIVIGYPDTVEQRVTIGSTVDVMDDGEPLRVRIVGCPLVYDQDDEVISIGVHSPLAEVITGRNAGEVVNMKVKNRDVEVEIGDIDQVKIHEVKIAPVRFV